VPKFARVIFLSTFFMLFPAVAQVQSWRDFVSDQILNNQLNRNAIEVLKKFGNALAHHRLQALVSRAASRAGTPSTYDCQVFRNEELILTLKIGDSREGKDWGHSGKMKYDFSTFKSFNAEIAASLLASFVLSIPHVAEELLNDVPSTVIENTIRYFLIEGRLASLGLGVLYDDERILSFKSIQIFGYLATDISPEFAPSIANDIARRGEVDAVCAIFDSDSINIVTAPHVFGVEREQIIAKSYPSTSGSGVHMFLKDIGKNPLPIFAGIWGFSIPSLNTVLKMSQAEPLGRETALAQAMELAAHLVAGTEASFEFRSIFQKEGESFADNFVGEDASAKSLQAKLKAHRLGLNCKEALAELGP
jgi:hypothetical protein